MKHFSKRALAYLIDCTLAFSVIMLVVQWAILSNTRESLGITNEWFENSWNMELYVLGSISLPVWFYFAYFDSNKTKGTIGKRVMKLSVQNLENQKLSPFKSFLRTLLKLSPWEISHLGVIFPTPLYFETEPTIRFLTILGILLFIAYMTSIALDSKSQSIYDKIIGTQVVEQ